MKKLFTKENFKKFFFSYIWLMVLVFAIDLITKWAIVSHFGKSGTFNGQDEMIQLIKGFLYIGESFNEGAAFSLGANETGRIIFIIVSVVLGGGLIAYYAISYKKLDNVMKIAVSLMIAGAIGNLIDRAFYWKSIVGFSGVVDWISVWFGSYPFPMFNIADSSLVVGVAILVVYFVIDAIKDGLKAGKEGKYKYSPAELEKQKNEENSSK